MNFGLTDATAGYDALGRMKVYTEAATATLPSANLSWDYDANGNIRRTVSTYVTVGGNGAASAPVTSDYWFRFDAMNRVVTDRGSLVNGQVVRAPAVFGQGGGQDIQYDAAGQRVGVLRTDQTIGGYYTVQRYETRESYAYDAGGRLIGIAQSTGQASSGAASGGAYVAPAPLAGTRRSSFGYDLAGHQTQQSDYEANGGTIVYSRGAVYGFDGRVTSESVSTKKSNGATYTSTSSYYYGSGGDYALGNVVSLSTSNTRNAVFQSSGTTTNSYVYQDGAVQSIIQYIPNSGSQGYTFFTYDALGTLASVQVNDGRSRTITFVNDIDGQIIRRDEQDASSQGDPHERWYRFGGRQLGYTGNNGTDDLTAAASIADRQVLSPTTPGAFRNGQATGTPHADFAQSYDPLNSYGQGSGAGSYRVRGGETLPGIAQNLWGDAGLWYKLAEANGLSATSTLTAGTTLTLPAGVVKTTHNANTLTPYDPAEAIGDVSPTTPQPNKPKKNKCGVFGAIISTVVAVAATYFLGPVVGNLVSQGFNNLIGTQSGFSWKSLAISVVSAGVTQGLGDLGAFGGVRSAFVQGALTQATASVITQGVSVAIGLQKKFDWVGVAAAGIVGGVSGGVGNRIGTAAGRATGSALVARLASATVASLAGAATRSALTGTSFGDNVLAVIPDVVAATLSSTLRAEFGDPSMRARAQVEDRPTARPTATTGGTTGQQAEGAAASSATGTTGNTDIVRGEADDIIVIADRETKILIQGLTDYQYGRYLGSAGNVSYYPTALWASRLREPSVNFSFSPLAQPSLDFSRPNFDFSKPAWSVVADRFQPDKPYDVPFGRSYRSMADYMRDGGQVIGNPQQPSAAQLAYRRYETLQSGLAGGPVSGLGLTVTLLAGGSEQTQSRVQQLLTPLDEAAMAAVALGGRRAIGAPPSNRLGVLDGRYAGTTAAEGGLGSISVPANLKYGTTLFGQEAHLQAGAVLQARLEAQGVTGVINRTGPGLTGVDMSVDARFVRQLGFEHIEIKPNTASGLRSFNTQVGKWGYDPATVRAVTYDAHGNLRWGFDF